MLWEGHSSLCSMVPSAAGSILQRALGVLEGSKHPPTAWTGAGGPCVSADFLSRPREADKCRFWHHGKCLVAAGYHQLISWSAR